METRRFTASEREGVMRLNMMIAMAIETEEMLAKRMKGIRGMKRDLKMIEAKGSKLLAEVLKTAPVEQYRSIQQNVRMCSYAIGAKRPGSAGTSDFKNYGVWISFETLSTILTGLQDHCMMCGLDKQSEAQCEIRKALDMVGSDVEHSNGRCGYRSHIA